jgi:DNA-binding transcriptional ArsR family regulator
VLANRTRLQILQLLLEQPGLGVSAVARRLGFTVPVASQSLRALEARGLLRARRVGRRVTYRPATDAASPRSSLVVALRRMFQSEPAPGEAIFKLATAFTHPRRIELFRAVHKRAGTPADLRAITGMSRRAMERHRRKLAARGFLTNQEGKWSVVPRGDAVGRELTRLAAG